MGHQHRWALPSIRKTQTEPARLSAKPHEACCRTNKFASRSRILITSRKMGLSKERHALQRATLRAVIDRLNARL
jgi:hypothetical protein